jgi:hypothetical protein
VVISPLILIIRAEYKDGISSVKTEEKKKTKKNREFHQTRYDSHDSYDTKEKEKKFEKIFNLLIKDFNNSPYVDKFITKTISDGIYFHYTFNNGYKISLYNEYLLLNKANGEELNSFALDSVQTIQMYRLINEIIDKAVNRNHRTYNQYDWFGQEQPKPKAEPSPETTGNPKLDKILEKIKLRKEQLAKMKVNDPERAALLNELKTYENVANKMKSK